MSVNILVGDCRDVLAGLPAESVQCCVTSPPYFNLRDYQIDGQIGMESTPEAFVVELVTVFREVRRVLRDDGTVWLNLGSSFASKQIESSQWTIRKDLSFERRAAVAKAMSSVWSGYASPKQAMQDLLDSGASEAGELPGLEGITFAKKVIPTGFLPWCEPVYVIKPKDDMQIPARVAFALQADGWVLRQDIIWSKANPMPESVQDRCTKAHEYVFLLTKRPTYYYDAKAVAEACEPTSIEHGRKYGHMPSLAAKGNPDRNDNGGRGTHCGVAPGRTTRNKRTVWTIASQPFSGAHFATMPPELAETCIKAGTSERGQCPSCGAPWARVVDVERVRDPNRHTGRAAVGCGDRKDGDTPRMISRSRTTGWSPTCACPAHEPIPQTVLDPFAGAGTTLMAAARLQRSAVGIELNPDYAGIARRRIYDDCPMFCGVDAAE